MIEAKYSTSGVVFQRVQRVCRTKKIHMSTYLATFALRQNSSWQIPVKTFVKSDRIEFWARMGSSYWPRPHGNEHDFEVFRLAVVAYHVRRYFRSFNFVEICWIFYLYGTSGLEVTKILMKMRYHKLMLHWQIYLS